MRVLVYETTPDRAKLIEDLLTNYRYKVYVFYKISSLKKIQDIKPSLIILNANQPRYMEFLVKIKEEPRFSSLPVILISKVKSQDILEKMSKLPNVDFLVEPFKIKNFRHMVERWITFRSLYVN